MMNKGIILGKFAPMHKGHKFAIMEASTHCSELTVLLCVDHKHDPNDITPEQREAILLKELKGCENISVEVVDCTSFPYSTVDDEEVSKYWAEALYKWYPDTGTLFGSEKYVEMMAKHWPDCNGVRHHLIDVNRKTMPISATAIRNETMRYFDYLVDSAKPLFTKNVLVIGGESTGKSSLVTNLGDVLNAPTVPEMYRSMFPNKGMDFVAEDLISVAKTQQHAAYCQAISPRNKGLIIHDTCNDVTLAYLNEYYPDARKIKTLIEEVRRSECKFDLILFCDIDVPWEQDGTRTLGGEHQRQRMRDLFYSIAHEKANRHGCPVVVLGADYKRIPDALEAISQL